MDRRVNLTEKMQSSETIAELTGESNCHKLSLSLEAIHHLPGAITEVADDLATGRDLTGASRSGRWEQTDLSRGTTAGSFWLLSRRDKVVKLAKLGNRHACGANT